ncbi:methyltransferase domain-containing protein [Paraburkholderia sp. SIMBA_027]|jgi:glycine/sarcosine N-methyltransferase|uniref:class I SAM-dependent methyltransferase n=1 Tax=Paraburkholderia sp. SIMBA_027 TaxID=3085770 RepID=UPI003978F124
MENVFTKEMEPGARDFVGQYHQSFVDRWDELINWDGRASAESGFFQSYLTKQGVRSVLDVACGTGYHAIDLSRAGFDVTASDGSETMVERTLRNAADRGQLVQAKVADWRSLTSHIDGVFDAVVCLGSSFCHLRSESDRRSALVQFRRVLKPGGILLIDQRNFDAILAGKYRTAASVAYCGDAIQVHFENAHEENVDFVYTFGDGAQFRLSVHPIRATALRHAIEEAGLEYMSSYGDFKEQYDPLNCGFVLHVCRNPAI